jgi:hypothetical protein
MFFIHTGIDKITVKTNRSNQYLLLQSFNRILIFWAF